MRERGRIRREEVDGGTMEKKGDGGYTKGEVGYVKEIGKERGSSPAAIFPPNPQISDIVFSLSCLYILGVYITRYGVV